MTTNHTKTAHTAPKFQQNGKWILYTCILTSTVILCSKRNSPRIFIFGNIIRCFSLLHIKGSLIFCTSLQGGISLLPWKYWVSSFHTRVNGTFIDRTRMGQNYTFIFAWWLPFQLSLNIAHHNPHVTPQITSHFSLSHELVNAEETFLRKHNRHYHGHFLWRNVKIFDILGCMNGSMMRLIRTTLCPKIIILNHAFSQKKRLNSLWSSNKLWYL